MNWIKPKSYKYILTGIFSLLAISLYMNNASKKDSDLLIVGTSADFAPFAFIKDKQIVGFDIDIANEIAKRIGKKIKIRNLDFDILVPDLQLGRIHMISAGLTPTKERAQKVLFTKSYINDGPLTILTLKSNEPIKSLSDLNNKEVIVSEGHTADLYMSKLKGPIIKRLANVSIGFAALNSNRGYAFVSTQNSLAPFLKKHGDKFNIFSVPNTDQTSAIAVSKDHPEFLKIVDKALDIMLQDGTIEKLKKKWEIK